MRAKAFPPLPPRLLALINEALAAVIRRRRERCRLKPAPLFGGRPVSFYNVVGLGLVEILE